MTIDVDAATEIVQASHILAVHGVVDAFGHVSRRSPDRPDRFLMSRSRAPALVTLEDIVELDFDGAPVSRPGERVFLERFIHAEIYRARPDATAVAHSHSPQVVPFTVVPGVRVEPICHICGFLQATKAPFDNADHVGPTSNLLISDTELGKRFAEHLGDGAVGLMRAHGFTTVGESMAEAVFRAIYTARNCQIHLAAITLGTPTFLSPEEADACEAATKGQADRAWDLWRHDLRSASSDH